MGKYKKIAIIGPCPPPYGGISVHIQRTLAHLDTKDYLLFSESPKCPPNIPSILFTGKSRYLKALRFLFSRFKVIHHHSPDLNLRLFLSFVGIFKKNIYLHIHGASLEDTFKKGGLRAWLLKRLLKFVHILADNTHIAEIAREFHPRSILEIDAFLPPEFQQEYLDAFDRRAQLPQADKRIFMCGWFSRYKNTDLYGFDLALEALAKIRAETKLNIKIMACVNGISDKDLYENFIQERKNLNLENDFILYDSNFEEIWPFYINSDIFLRPTCSDGSALSVKESTWFETRVLASDCVPRPKDIHLFKNQSVDSLLENLRLLLKESGLSKQEKIEKMKYKTFSYPLFEKVYEL